MMPRAGLDLQIVLQAAAEMADQKGLNNVVLAALAKKLRIRTPSIYNHVDGLKGLRKELSVYGLNRLYDCMTRAAIGRSRDDAVRSLAAAYISFAREHPGLYEAAQIPPDRQDDNVQQAAGRVVEVVQTIFQSYGMDEETAVHMVRGFRSVLHGFASLDRQGGFGMPLDKDESIRLLIEIFLAGIHARLMNR